MKKNRIIYIDYLKAIGLLLVILAHVECPKYIMQFRSFDVPLLVVLSGYLASKTYVSGNSKKYYWKRIQRLVIPAWIFLIIFFIVQSVAYSRPTVKNIIKAVTFQRDADMVGMLWVIWVYLICALLIPVIYKIGYNKKSNIIIMCVFVAYELLCMTTDISSNRIIYITLLTIIPWGAITYLGFYLDQITKKQKMIIISLGIIIFLSGVAYFKVRRDMFISTNDYKYPARLYYFSYAIPIIFILIKVFREIPLKNNKLISFISSSSLWIYLWHILVLYVVKSIIVDDRLWILQYAFILSISIIITWIQNVIIKYLISNYKLYFLKVFLG